MTRCTRATLLMLVILWQALAWLTPVGQMEKTGEVANLMAHANLVDHHHHDDRSLHMDDSADSPGHYHAHEAVQPVGLVPVTVDYLVVVPPAAPPVAHAADVASVFLEGPLRPPQSVV